MAASLPQERETLTRDAVISAARSMIAESGLDSVSLRQVGGFLGVTAPALYAYVADKRDLLRGVAEHEFGVLQGRFAAVEERAPIERIRQLSRVYIDYALENPELFRTMFLFPPDLAFSASTGVELASATTTFNYALDTVRQAIDEGALRADLDPLVATFVAWTATHGIATALLLGFAFDEATRLNLIEAGLDAMLAGLRAP